MSKINEVSAIYDRDYYEAGGHGSSYNGYDWGKLSGYFMATAGHMLRHFNPANILDVGCAKGYMVMAFNKLGVQAYGIDASAYAIGNAPPEIAARIRQGLIQSLPLADNSHDLVTALDILEHIPEEEARAACSELLRVSRKWVVANILTAERPDYSDQTHITVKEREWWVDIFKSLGGKPVPIDEYVNYGIWWFNVPERLVVITK